MKMIGQVWTMQKQLKPSNRFITASVLPRGFSADDEPASFMTGQEEQSIVQGRWTELIKSLQFETNSTTAIRFN
jgi:hypothetical protein